MSEQRYQHAPVMLNETLELLNIKKDGIYVDGTLGLGGHAQAVISRLSEKGRFIGLDQDTDALNQAKENLEVGSVNCDFVHSNFEKIPEVLIDKGINRVDGILLDLGVSSLQLDNPERGFSFRSNGPLDMRMDYSKGQTAAYLVNTLSEHELSTILSEYGEEKNHKRIAREIVQARVKEPIKTTAQLAQLIQKVAGPVRGFKTLHPATRSFQALRIAVNCELDVLKKVIPAVFQLLSLEGRLVIISFHSLEDRIVKTIFRELADEKRITLLTKKPLRPTDEETKINPRARSARVRGMIKICD